MSYFARILSTFFLIVGLLAQSNLEASFNGSMILDGYSLGLTNSYLSPSVIAAQEGIQGSGTLASNLDSVQKITKDEQRQGLNFSVDTDPIKKGVDMVDSTKREAFIDNEAHDFSGLTRGGEATKRVGDAASDTSKVIGGTLSGKIDLGQAVDVLANSRLGSLRDHQEQKAQDEPMAKAINNLIADGQTASGVQSILKADVEGATTVLGGSNKNADGTDRQVSVYTQVSEENSLMKTPDQGDVNKNQAAGITEAGSKDIAFNLNNPELQNGSNVEEKTTHEAAHRAGYSEGMANLMGDVASSVWTEQNAKYDRTTGTDTESPKAQQTQQAWVAQQQADPVQNSVIQAGNKKIETVKNGEAIIPPQVIGAVVGGGADYLLQIGENKLEGKTWGQSLTDVNLTSIAISAAAGATGVGLATKAEAALDALRLSKSVLTVAKVGAGIAIDAGVSAGSQYAKDGEISGTKVAIDMGAGVLGSQLGKYVFKTAQGSSVSSKLYREADELSTLTSVNPPIFKNQVNTAKEAVKEAKNYGLNLAIGSGAAASNSLSGSFELREKVKQANKDKK